MPQAPGSCKRYSGHGSRLDAEVPLLKQGLLQALKWAVLFFFLPIFIVIYLFGCTSSYLQLVGSNVP